MNDLRCETASTAVAEALGQEDARVASDVAEHIAGCAICRSAILGMIQNLGGVPNLPEPSNHACAACQNDLAAFIDLELEDPARAARLYSQVWWHLWMCPRCTRAHDLTHTLIQGERAGLFQSLRSALGL